MYEVPTYYKDAFYFNNVKSQYLKQETVPKDNTYLIWILLSTYLSSIYDQ